MTNKHASQKLKYSIRVQSHLHTHLWEYNETNVSQGRELLYHHWCGSKNDIAALYLYYQIKKNVKIDYLIFCEVRNCGCKTATRANTCEKECTIGILNNTWKIAETEYSYEYSVKTELREVFEKCFNLKQKCLVATEISHAVFHNSDTECLDHPNSYLQLFGQ